MKLRYIGAEDRYVASLGRKVTNGEEFETVTTAAGQALLEQPDFIRAAPPGEARGVETRQDQLPIEEDAEEDRKEGTRGTTRP